MSVVGYDVSIAIGGIAVTGRNATVSNGGRKPRANVKSLLLKKCFVLLEGLHALPKRLFVGEESIENQENRIGFSRSQLTQYPFSLNRVILRKLNGNAQSVCHNIVSL